MSILVQSPGALATVQDAGRLGHAAQGYRSCGACDPYALQAANLLAGNEPHAAALELTLTGGSYLFEEAAVFALAGAAMPAALNGTPVPRYCPLYAAPGDTLTLGPAAEGLRCYLAVHGGIAVPPVLGSRSTDLKCRLGGFEGRALRAGDRLPVGCTQGQAADYWIAVRQRHADHPLGEVSARHPTRAWRFVGGQRLPLVRAVPGPQAERFSAAAHAALLHGCYTLTADSDRMGCKLQGPALEAPQGVDILSDGIVAGSVQVSANGQPIVMLADHQTTGGYAKIATVMGADLPTLAQLRPGDALCFDYVTPAQAVQAARKQGATLQQIRERMP